MPAGAAQPGQDWAPPRQTVPEGLDDITVLTAVMAELGECRRILENALKPAAEPA
jgi:hypothetical protein